jgi:hypothetical protein
MFCQVGIADHKDIGNLDVFQATLCNPVSLKRKSLPPLLSQWEYERKHAKAEKEMCWQHMRCWSVEKVIELQRMILAIFSRTCFWAEIQDWVRPYLLPQDRPPVFCGEVSFKAHPDFTLLCLLQCNTWICLLRWQSSSAGRTSSCMCLWRCICGSGRMDCSKY